MPRTLHDARRPRQAPLRTEIPATDVPQPLPTPGQRYFPDLGTAAELFRILSDPTRLRILGNLARRPHNVTELRKRLNIPQPTTSHHLNQLRRFDLVTSRRAGKQVVYSLGPCIRADRDGCIHLDTLVPGTRLELCLRPAPAAAPADAPPDGLAPKPADPSAADPLAQALAKVWPV